MKELAIQPKEQNVRKKKEPRFTIAIRVGDMSPDAILELLELLSRLLDYDGDVVSFVEMSLSIFIQFIIISVFNSI